MKQFVLLIAGALTFVGDACSIPQEFFGGQPGFGGGVGGGGVAILQGEDFSDAFLDPAAWDANELPGEWFEVPSHSDEDVRAMKKVPLLFGAYPQRVFVASEGGKLKAISILYLDAGAFFGYGLPDGSETAEEERERKRRIRERQREFRKKFKDIVLAVEIELQERAESRPKKERVGRTAVLRTDYLSYATNAHVLRFASYEDHAISLTIVPKGEAADHYLNEKIASQEVRKRRQELAAHVTRGTSGDVTVEGVPVFRQGLQPYCAINTLGMVTHYFGLRLGTTGLAAGAKFKNTGSAKGSKLLELYRAAAEESGAKLSRSGRADFSRIKRAIDKGFPVLVWRRYSTQRNRLHSRFARELLNNPEATLPEVTRDERSTWPANDAPGHSSVISGYNEQRGEVIFMESWGEHSRNRRMRIEEMEETSYMTFYFKV